MATSLRSELQNARMEAAAQLSELGVELHSSASSGSRLSECWQRIRAGSNGHLRSTRERADSGGEGVREFKAELEGIERKLQSQEDIFVNRSLAVCECFFAVRFEDHSDVLAKKLSARNCRSRLT